MEFSSKTKRAAPKNAQFSSHTDFYQNSAYAAFPQEVRAGGSYSQNLVQVDQDPIDFIDAATPDFVITMPLTSIHECTIDIGDGANRYTKMLKDALVLYPAQAEARTLVTSEHSIINFSIPQLHVSDLLERAGIYTDPFRSKFGQLLEDPVAALLIKTIWRAAKSSHSADSLLIDGLTLQLLARLVHQDAKIVTSELSAPSGKRKLRMCPSIISSVDLYIDEHMNTDIRVKDLAQLAGMSEFHFLRIFKDAVGKTPYQHIMDHRLKRAKRLLAIESMSLAQIAYACGFSSQSHMNNLFRNRIGVTPKQYREIRRS